MEVIATTAKTLISVQQADKLAAVSPAHIYRLIQRGEIEAIRVGSNPHAPLRISRHDFTRWLYEQEEDR